MGWSSRGGGSQPFENIGQSESKCLDSTILPIQRHPTNTGGRVELGIHDLTSISINSSIFQIQFLYHDFGMSSISAKLDHNATPRSTFLAQCFPLYSILLAIGRTTIDYFAMDMEDSELGVLQSIPWDKVVIKVLSIEVHPQYVEPVLNYMTSIGYLYIKFMKFAYTSDQVYVHRDFLAELNQTLLQAEGL